MSKRNRLVAVLGLAATAACSAERSAEERAAEEPPAEGPVAEEPVTEGLAAEEPAAAAGDAAAAAGCAATGELRGALHGGIEGDIDWRGEALACEGMPRPDGAGARLRFAGRLAGGDAAELAFIIALPELERGRTVDETPATVTVIEENEGRFFSNADADVCWSDVVRQQIVAGDVYAIDGIVYCVAPLAEVNGRGGVSFTELVYSGRVDWAGS